MNKGTGVFLGLVSLLVLFGAGLGSLVWYTGSKEMLRGEMVPALLVIVGVIGLLLLFIGAGIAYQHIGLADHTQAFGLPEGSIRAVIATMALLLFGIVPLFLYASLSASPICNYPGRTRLEAIDLKNGLKENFISTSPSLLDAPPVPATPANVNIDKTQYTVFYHGAPPAAAADLAKQFFTALATLVAAMSSFFFGSAVATSAAKAGANVAAAAASPTPSLQNMTPSSVQRPAPGSPPHDETFKLLGNGLDLITTVELVQGTTVIRATNVTSNPMMAQFTVPVDSNTPLNAWTVIVTSSDTLPKKATLPNALQITAEAPSKPVISSP